MQKVPIGHQGLYSGAYWSESTGTSPCRQEEQDEWDKWNISTPEEGPKIFASWQTEPKEAKPPVSEEEPGPEWRSGVYWLPIFANVSWGAMTGAKG